MTPLSKVAERLRAQGFQVRADDAVLSVGRPGAPAGVLIREEACADGRAIVMHAPICGEHVVSARAILVRAADLAGGAVALAAGMYVLRFAIGLDDVSDAPVAQLVVQLRDRADQFSRSLRRTRSLDA